jgi:predicted ester cyclase
MSAELKRLVQRFYDEMLNVGQLNVLDELLRRMRSTATRRSAFRLAWKEPNNDLPGWRSAFPDLRYTVKNITADRDRVVVQFVLEGIQHGEFLGIAPTSKTVRALVMTSYRFTDGRIAERVHYTLGTHHRQDGRCG